VVIKILESLVVVIVFIYIYGRYKKQEEQNLVLKLVGYYLLGSFRLNFNELGLPAGYVAYLLFFRPAVNTSVKRRMVILGLVVFISGILIPKMEEVYFERPRKVEASSSNLYTLDLAKDLKIIKQKFKLEEMGRIENFEVNFDRDGSIRELSYKLLTRDNSDVIIYNIELLPSKKIYTIRARRHKQWFQFDRLISEDRLFEGFSKLDISQVIPETEYAYYNVKCTGEYMNWGVRDWENYVIREDGIKKLQEKDLPVKGYNFWVSGSKKTVYLDHVSFETADNRAFILP
jgi:hypothetical protein